MILVVLREAEAGIDEAFRWYPARRVGLRRECIAEVDSASERALEALGSFPVVYRGLQRIVLERFPYLVYFRAHDETLQSFGVLQVTVIAARFDGAPSCRNALQYARVVHRDGPPPCRPIHGRHVQDPGHVQIPRRARMPITLRGE